MHNCDLHIPDSTLMKTVNLVICVSFFFLLAEVRKRRKSLRRRFDSFSKEKKERGGFVAQTLSWGRGGGVKQKICNGHKFRD